jgi:hypothetical protein
MCRVALVASIAVAGMTNLGDGAGREAPGIGQTVPGAVFRMY